MLEGRDGGTVAWNPNEIAGRTGGAEVYRAEEIELRAGDRVRWTRNDKDTGLVNSRNGRSGLGERGPRPRFRLEEGRTFALGRKDPQLCHLDHAWASTVHAFQGAHGGQRDRGDGGRPPTPDDAEEFLRRDQPGQGSCPSW